MLIPTESIDTPGKKSNLSTMAEEEYDEWNQGEEEEEEGIDSMIIGGVVLGIVLGIGVILYCNKMLCFKGEKGKKVEEVSEEMKKETEKIKTTETEGEEGEKVEEVFKEMKKETEKIKTTETENKSKVEFIDEDGDTQIYTYHEESKTWDFQQKVSPENKGRIEEGKDFTDTTEKGVTLQFEPAIGYIEWDFFSNVVPEDQRTAVMEKMKVLQPEYYPALIPTDEFTPKLLNFDATENKWEYEWYNSENEKRFITKTDNLPIMYSQLVGYGDEDLKGDKLYNFMENVMKACDKEKLQDYLNGLNIEELQALTILQDNDDEIQALTNKYTLEGYRIKEIIQEFIDIKLRGYLRELNFQALTTLQDDDEIQTLAEKYGLEGDRIKKIIQKFINIKGNSKMEE